MESFHNVAKDTYRLVVTRRNASEILLVPDGDTWLLPSVDIVRDQRAIEQLTTRLQTEWGFRGYCLFIPSLAESHLSPHHAKCAVMAAIKERDQAPRGARWMPSYLAHDQHERFLEEDSGALKKSFQDLTSYTREPSAGPFATPEWLSELFGWAQEQIEPLGLRLTGNFRQLNASPTFSLIRLETTGGAVWFKATGQPNLHELPISVALARLFPQYTPCVLGIHPSWNGWLSREVSGATLDHLAGFDAWEKVAEDLARLQIQSIGKDAELLESQCKDLRLRKLLETIDPFLARMAELMTAQEKRVPAALTNPELDLLGVHLKQACSRLRAFDLPDTLGHLDLNRGNIVVSNAGSVFLDWAEGCVSNALITFEYLCEQLRRSTNDMHAVRSTVAAYVRAWQPFLSSDTLKQAMVISPLLAVFAYAVSTDTWCSSEVFLKPSLAGYFRALTRRMYRDAFQTMERTASCLA